MTDYTPSVDTTIFPRINFIKNRTARLAQRIANGRVAMFFQRLFNNASLDLKFAKTKAIGDLVTFSRASSGTYVGSDGLIKTSPVNLVTYSEQFNQSVWIKGRVVVTANAIESPDGTQTAELLTETTANGEHYVGVNQISVTSGQAYTVSCFVKANGRSHVYCKFVSRFPTGPGTIDLNTGTFTAINGTGITSTALEDHGNGWYRFSFTSTATSTGNAFILFGPAKNASTGNYAGDTTSGIYVWGAQVEEGTTATDYIPTGATINGAPRFDHDPATGESLGLLIEESRTNLIKYSSDLSQSYWEKKRVTATAVQESNPFDYTDVYRVRATGGSYHELKPNISNFTANTASTFSAFATADGTGADAGLLQLRIFGLNTSAPIVNFDLNTGTANAADGLSGTTANGLPWTISDYGLDPCRNGWYRVWMTAQVSNAGTAGFLCINDINASDVGGIHDYTASGTGGFLVAGVQVEAGSFKTSAIPTSGSNVTRSPDIATIEGNKFAKTNLLSYSERFDQWNKTSATTITPNATASPDGTITADLIDASSINTGQDIEIGVTPLPDGTPCVFSFYIKSFEGLGDQTLYAKMGRTGYSGGNLLELYPFTINETWQRISIVDSGLTIGNTKAFFGIGCGIGSGGTAKYYIWGAQVEEGSELTEYTPSVETFDSRASSATYVDDTTGLIKTTPVNFASYSEQFDQWTKGSTTTVTANAVVAPDGSMTADRLQMPTGSGTFLRSLSSAPGGVQYTYSAYIKASSSSISAGNNTVVMDINSENRTRFVATESWKRVSFTYTTVGTGSAGFDNELAGAADMRAVDVYIWGAQLEEGPTASPYIKTGSTISGAARYESGELILEEARTNSLPHSASLSLFNTLTTIPAPSQGFTAPDGSTDAFQYPINSTNRLQSNRNVPAGQTHTLSFFAKQGDGTNLQGYNGFNVGGPRDPNGSIYNWTTGVLQSGWTKEDYANGWSRFYKSYTSTTGTLFVLNIKDSEGVLLWGFQFELNTSFPTSYIPTTGSTVTRAADVSTSALGVDSWYNQSEGTLFVAVDKAYKTNTIAASFDDGSGDNRIEVRSSGGSLNNARYVILDNSNTLYNKEPSNTGADNLKLALAYKTGSVNNATNGVVGTVAATASIPNVSRLAFQNESFLSEQRPGHISRLAYFPTRKTDQELVKLTGGTLFNRAITYGITIAGNTFSLRTNGTVNYAVDWDSTGGYQTSTANTLAHTYADGDYTLVVYSDDSFRPYNNNKGDGDRITSVVIDAGANLSTNLFRAWKGVAFMTSFVCPFHVTSHITQFKEAWFSCQSLTSFPLIDASNGGNFENAWRRCYSLTSFPSLDVSSGTTFNTAWRECTSLTSFPSLDVSSGIVFANAWWQCSSLTSFPLLDVSSGTRFESAWRDCTSLANFPANMFDTTGTLASNAFTMTWFNCALTAQSIKNILVSLDTNGASNITLNINSGTNAAKTTWSTAANTAYDNLIAKGWTISFNA